MELVQAMRNISVSGRVGLLFSVSMIAMLAALAACDDTAPANSTKVRPGAERQIGASNALPAATAGRQYDTAIAPIDETRGPKIGSMVAESGGQKAQLEKQAKEIAERDAKAREERERQRQLEAERKANEPKEAKKPPASAPASSEPPTQTAAAAPPAPVAAAPVPPPDAGRVPRAAPALRPRWRRS